MVSLGDYCVKIGSGATPRGGSSVYKEYGEICLIRSQNIYNDGFKSQGLVYIDEDAAKKLKNVVIEKNDILLNITGDSVARVCLAVERYLPARVNQHVAIIRPNPKEFDARYLRYVISSPFMQKVLLNLASAGATRNALTKTMIETLEVSKPPLIIQKNIADCLESLDDKIFLNNETNQTLEQMAQALFKSWFVDFDPVFDNLLASVDFKLESLENRLPDNLKLKAQRRLAVLNSLENAAECKASLIALAHELQAQLPTKEATQAAVQVLGKTAETPVKANVSANPKILAQHANTHAHFPNEFEHNEQLGWIPKGWDIKAVSETIQINPRTSLSKGAIAKFADMKSIPTSGYMVDEIIEKAFSGGVKFKRNDILLARITPCLQNGKTAWVDFLKEDEVGFGSTEFIVLRENNKISFPFIACLAKDDSFRAHCMQSMVGSSGRQRVQNACFDSYYLALPKGDVLKDMFTELTKPNFKKMTNNKLESESLTKLRDTLLPKLISGELQIPDLANISDSNIYNE
ncbi:restriction endonuclease subunit S [Pseudoalteromonas tetraodonis]|uniref:restriction endonuclease subunit S n=1 Tax=Pseudoalteromonas tetraodonis TaxID=43659 RepID=UPI0020C7F55D|nr:restriction endonuclease subunit S [Pseudoalteromonas tetraodonis]